MSPPPRQMDLQEFVDAGYLQEANRQFFHPLGLALSVVSEGGRVVALGGVWDGRDDEEGFYFEGLTASEGERGRVIVAEQGRRLAIRRAALGYGLQRLPE